jgi:hypothetical protein
VDNLWFLTFLTNLLRIDYLSRTRQHNEVSSKGHYGLLALPSSSTITNFVGPVKEIAKNQ